MSEIHASWELAPPGWPTADTAAVERLTERILRVLERPTVDQCPFLWHSYGPDSAPLLWLLEANPPGVLTAADVLAASAAVGEIAPDIVRRLLLSPHRGAIREVFVELPDHELALVGPSGLDTMEFALDEVRAATGTKNRRFASAICARLRPDLFPWFAQVRIPELDLDPVRERRQTWIACRQLLGDPHLVQRVDASIPVPQGAVPPAGTRLQGLALLIDALSV